MRSALLVTFMCGCTAFVDADRDRLEVDGVDATVDAAAPPPRPERDAGSDAAVEAGPPGCEDAQCPRGAKERRDCEEGRQERTCGDDCRWGEWSSCRCVTGLVDLQPCGACGERLRVCDEDGEWSPWSECQGDGEGQVSDEERACGRCGVQVRESIRGCEPGAWSECREQGACSPGEVRTGPCDPCSEQRCDDTCEWSACALREGAECDYLEGANYRCCGDSAWQFCLPECVWSEQCAECDGCCWWNDG